MAFTDSCVGCHGLVWPTPDVGPDLVPHFLHIHAGKILMHIKSINQGHACVLSLILINSLTLLHSV